MLISANPQSLTNNISNARQIAANGYGGGVILYTVPAGKKFVGYIYGASTAANYSITPSGGVPVSMTAPATSATNLSHTAFQLVLIAGTTVANAGANTLQLIGVESDL